MRGLARRCNLLAIMTEQKRKTKPTKAFDCQMCSQCCTGEGAAWFEEHELAAAAELLSLSVEEFVGRHCRIKGDKYEIICNNDGVCSVLGPNGCLIHQAKPRICQAWPFLNAMLKNESAFESAKAVCPGMNPDATHQDFLAQYEAETPIYKKD